MKTVKDWAGQRIPFNVRPTLENEQHEPGEWLTCELDPHGVGQWQVRGRGRTTNQAILNAITAWNKFDRQTA